MHHFTATLSPARALWLLAALVCSTTLLAQHRIPLDGTWQIRDEATPDAAFRDIAVPSSFETALGVDFDGVARYRRTLPLPTQRTERTFVEFEAVATHAQVFCNGKRVGEHLGGWTPFRVELTRHLKWDGNDTIEVVCDERVGHNTQGFLPIIQPHFGGIWQSVTMCCEALPTLDRQDLFVFGNGDGDVTVLAGVVGQGIGRTLADQLQVRLFDGDQLVTEQRRRLDAFADPLHIDAPKHWSPSSPHLYRAELTLLAGERELDRESRAFGCRDLRADGTTVLWNDSPLQMRGILHWGYSPPALAPPPDMAHWRPQLEYFQRLGFNTIKCCLWVPPRGFYELCDELGMLVWQEYPTWHPQMDQAHKAELIREYHEFFRLDRSHPSVGFRSITCETGQGADLDVVTALFTACKSAVPDTLVVDDSSWIGWQRITDFWDEHPYGNNSWFPGRLDHFLGHMRQHGDKPLLLGECLAADTWVPRQDWLEAHGERELWWRPLCWDAQADAEPWLVREFGQATLQSLQPIARRFGLRNRKFQIEQLRTRIPDAGYVVSVARDFQKARMGLLDDLDRPKWSAGDWQWHGDTMLCLEAGTPGSATRTIGPGADAGVTVRVAHYGNGELTGRLRVWCSAPEGAGEVTADVTAIPGQAPAEASVRFAFHPDGPRDGQPRRVRVHAELTGSHTAKNHWDLWLHPGTADVTTDADAATVIEADALTPELLDQLIGGARVLLHVAGDRENAPRSEGIWVLKGAPFAPPHPAHERLPKDFLLDTVGFDLESGRVIPWQPWRDQVDPILAFWDTHDIEDVRFHLHAFDTRVGSGRLLVTTLRLEGDERSVGAFTHAALKDHLLHGPPSQRALSDATIAALRQHLNAHTVELDVWRFRTDPDDTGRADGWFAPSLDTSDAAGWRDLKAGSHWENQGDDLKHYTGVAWYRVDVDVPESWQSLDARAVFDGVDDSFDLWLNGEHLGTFGDEHVPVTIWLEQQVQELGDRLRSGERNTLVLRVVDHAGAGGMWKPARLTTGPVGDASKLLR